MTATTLPPRLGAPDLDSAVDAVRAGGLRLTRARQQVLEFLFGAAGPVSVAEIAAAHGLEEASVYRNLEALEALGLVRHVHLGHGPGRYALADRSQGDFLHCERCGSSQVVAASVLSRARAEVRAATGFEAHFTHFPITGLCPACVADQRAHHPPVTDG